MASSMPALSEDGPWVFLRAKEAIGIVNDTVRALSIYVNLLQPVETMVPNPETDCMGKETWFTLGLEV